MIHTALDKLTLQTMKSALAALDEMRSDPKLKSYGVTEIVVSETLRELPVQMAYFSRSRMSVDNVQAMYAAAGLYAIKPDEANRVATWTLESRHLKGEALDIVPYRNGKAWWNAPAVVWERMGEIGERHGLELGGRWKNKDCPHFEVAK